MKYFLLALITMVIINISCWADSNAAKVSPLNDIFIPLGENTVLARAFPTGKYPFIKETPRSYLILFQRGTDLTVGLIPKYDSRRSPTAYVDNNNLVIRSGVNTSIYSGYIPFEKDKRYDVIENTVSGYKARFTFGDFSTICELAKTSVIYISEADILREQQAAEQERIRRAEQYRKQEEEKQASIQAAAEEQARLQQERISEIERRRREKAAEEEKWRQERFQAEQLKLKQLESEVMTPDNITVAAYRASKPLRDIVFKAYAQLSDYYNYDFSDSDNSHYSIRLSTTDNESIGHGYIRKNEMRGAQLFHLLEDGKWHLMNVRVHLTGSWSDPSVFVLENFQPLAE